MRIVAQAGRREPSALGGAQGCGRLKGRTLGLGFGVWGLGPGRPLGHFIFFSVLGLGGSHSGLFVRGPFGPA